MIKEGFIYIWYDRKRKMYYVGCHWGNINDGYICSSNWMRKTYRRRPQDFTRKIIEKGLLKDAIFDRERYWLSFIKENELGKKYYNLRNYEERGGSSFTEEAIEKIRQASRERWVNGVFSENSINKMRVARSGKKNSIDMNRKISEGNKGKKRSKEAKQKYKNATKNQFANPLKRENHRQAMLEWWKNKKMRLET